MAQEIERKIFWLSMIAISRRHIRKVVLYKDTFVVPADVRCVFVSGAIRGILL